MCYLITAAGLEVLRANDRLPEGQGSPLEDLPAASRAQLAMNDRALREARRDVHAAGWALACERALGRGLHVRGAAASVLSPPMRSTPEGRVALGPGDLRLPGGRTPHEFLRTDAAGQRLEVRRFETVRPALTIELPEGPRGVAADQRIPATDLLVELDDRLAAARDARGIAKLERYDHLVAGWAVQTGRYGRRMQGPPSVVFVCRDRVRARECARRADAVLTACRAYAGEYPAEWEYPGRERKFGDSVKKAE